MATNYSLIRYEAS